MILLPGVGLVVASLQTPATDNLANLAAEAQTVQTVASSTSGCGASWPESTYVRRIRTVTMREELEGAASLNDLLDAVVNETV